MNKQFSTSWNGVLKAVCLIALSLFIVLSASIDVQARTIRPADIAVPENFAIEVAAQGLAAPTMVTFDEQGRMLIAESAYGGGGEPKVTRIEPDGKKTILASGKAFGDELPITAVGFHDNQVYVVHAGTVSIIQSDGSLDNIITGLPGRGDHQANQLIFQDNFMYLSIGTVTNSAVVGPDNAVFGWLKRPENRQLHDVPCADITLTDQVFESENPLANEPQTVKTSAFSAFGTVLPAGSMVKGDVKCNGAVLRARPDGSKLEVYAWGFRNPYGLEIGPDRSLYVTMHGFDARGSRPVEDAWDCFYKVEQNAWYGWPDYACDIPISQARFRAKDKPQPQFLLEAHPSVPPKPLRKFTPHAATNGFAFAPSDQWGKATDVFVTLFGDFTPATGTVHEPQGVKVVRLDTTRGEIADFITNKVPGVASRHSGGGLEHPSDVTFGPDGNMYLTDWGVAHITVDGLKLEPDSGVVWKVVAGSSQMSVPGGPGLVTTLLGLLALASGTGIFAQGHASGRSPRDGIIMGIIAGLVMCVVAMIISAVILRLPWYAPPRVFATMVMGRDAVANILEFEPLSFLIGLLILIVLTALFGIVFALLLFTWEPGRVIVAGLFFGLTTWALLQYVVLPLLFPLVAEKGFPPIWYAVTFAAYGLVLGFLFAGLSRR
jgi:glucose/arabinose dehydrogenase